MAEPIEKEKITIQKFLGGLIAPKTGVKALAFLPWIILFLFIGFTIWKAYIKKPEPSTTIHAEAGSEIDVIYQANKRHLILFGEPYVFAEGGDRSRTGVGVRAGLRWEF
jgi:hypothetical protein